MAEDIIVNLNLKQRLQLLVILGFALAKGAVRITGIPFDEIKEIMSILGTN